jgi:D-alanyl-D-alanine carboxypeptidase/D-alanyl-D-alanine-endopeptidase (penicillin-binding protein 4)
MLKVSQNMHAEVLLRRLGLIEGAGSAADGHAVIHAMLAEAGVERTAYDFADGSGMSTYNRLSPRMVTHFLRWTRSQPWGEAFRDALPVGGVDGTLSRRFAGTSLEGRIFAKTGTLSAVNALSGFMIARSGKALVFSAYANDWPASAGSATPVLDAMLVRIAEAN